MTRYTVLTYIINDYENVIEIQEKDSEAEYILVTDNPNLTSDTWNVIYDASLENLSVFDKCYKIRFFPFNYCKSDICLRIDGNVKIKRNLKPLIDEFDKENYDLSVMIHPERNKISDEYFIWYQYRHYPMNQVKKCLDFMYSLGYNFDYKGLYQGTFVIQRKNKINGDINRLTYSFLKYLGEDETHIERLDQTIFSFVLNKFFSNAKIMCVGEDLITHSSLLQWYIHKTSFEIPYKNNIQPFLFNKPITIKKFD